MRALRFVLGALIASKCAIALAQQPVQQPVTSCDAAGIGASALTADGVTPRITEVSTGKQGSVDYCLVKVLVPQSINIWVGLPMQGAWNGRWQSVGGGVYAGSVNVPAEALAAGYAAATTDTGHTGGRPGVQVAMLDGSFGMLRPGEPNTPLQQDFAYRSEHLMAVIGKQLVLKFYGRAPEYSYWNGCSTGGRQGLRMVQDFPDDYDGVLAGAPAIHWDRFQAAMLWYPMVARLEWRASRRRQCPGARCQVRTGQLEGRRFLRFDRWRDRRSAHRSPSMRLHGNG